MKPQFFCAYETDKLVGLLFGKTMREPSVHPHRDEKTTFLLDVFKSADPNKLLKNLSLFCLIQREQ